MSELRGFAALAAWGISVFATVSIFNFMVNDASVLAFVILAGLLHVVGKMIGVIRARRARGVNIWSAESGRWMSYAGGPAGYLVFVVIMVTAWVVVLIQHPVYFNPFEPFAWQLPALQGYLTAIIGQFFAVSAGKLFDKMTGHSD